MKLKFCCRDMKMNVAQGNITLTKYGKLEIITVDMANRAIGIELKYCPFCGDRIE